MKKVQHFFTVTEAAIEKKCTRNTIYKLIREGKIKTIKAGKRTLIVDDEDFHNLTLSKDRLMELEEKVKLLERQMKELQHLLKKTSQQKESKIYPKDTVLGFKLKQRKNSGIWIIETKVDGRRRQITIGKDRSQAEEKIRAWHKKHGIELP